MLEQVKKKSKNLRMIIDADTTRKNLKALLEREEVTPSVNISKERRDNFKAACDLEGFKKVSIVFEDLIGQVVDSYFEVDKKLKMEVEGLSDRILTSISCENKKWQAFRDGCNKNHLKVGEVIEAIMGDYIGQVEKLNKVKISNGKEKK